MAIAAMAIGVEQPQFAAWPVASWGDGQACRRSGSRRSRRRLGLGANLMFHNETGTNERLAQLASVTALPHGVVKAVAEFRQRAAYNPHVQA